MCLPTNGTARFGGALGLDDFTKDVHVVSVTEESVRWAGPHVETLAMAEGLDAHAESVRIRLRDLSDESLVAGGNMAGGNTDGRKHGGRGQGGRKHGGRKHGGRGQFGRSMSFRPPVRDDLAELPGYHSPQIDVDHRLNTNESPEPPPHRVPAKRSPTGVAATGLASLSRSGRDRAALQSWPHITQADHAAHCCRQHLRRQRFERGTSDDHAGLGWSESVDPHVRTDVCNARPDRSSYRHGGD